MDDLAGELKINLGIISTTFKQGPINKDIYARLAIVTRYIEHNEPVGSIDNPSKWIKDTIHLRWGRTGVYLKDKPDEIVCFGGSTEKTVFGFGGSLHHVIGAEGPDRPCGADSTVPALLAALSKEVELSDPAKNYVDSLSNGMSEEELSDHALGSVDFVSLTMRGPLQNVEILAKKLLLGTRVPNEEFGYGETQTKTLLGTPIYVAMSE
ncbi:MAG: hypothetical protein JRE88_13275 [Deltaproteobacteria bacterium]|nr:hypothetical protein [Deltaproteobacteria bacterium]MBW2517748.1 hypothetical protein [Deltaproteobacteria bacterium]